MTEIEEARALLSRQCAHAGHFPMDHGLRQMCGNPLGPLVCECGKYTWRPTRGEEGK